MSLAYLLDLLLTDAVDVKSSMRKSAIARCRRALRSVRHSSVLVAIYDEADFFWGWTVS